MIIDRVFTEAEAWHRKYDKPVLMSEYGADTLSGQHEVRNVKEKILKSIIKQKKYIYIHDKTKYSSYLAMYGAKNIKPKCFLNILKHSIV